MAQLTALLVSHDDEFKRQAATLLRACGVPVGIVDGRAHGRRRIPTSWSSTSARTRLRAWRPSNGCARRSRRWRSSPSRVAAEPDLILRAMRAGANEFFPWTTGRADAGVALDGGVVPRRRAPDRRPARGGHRQRAAAVRHSRVPRRQGRRRHDDGVGELRRRAGAAVEASDGHRRPEAVPRRGRAVPRRAAAVHGARRHREPAPARQGVPQGAGVEAQVRPRHPGGLRTVRPAERTGRGRDRGAAARARAAPTTTSSSTRAT